jgi:hypothetical protein
MDINKNSSSSADGPNDHHCSIEESLGYDIDEYSDDGVNKLKI